MTKFHVTVLTITQRRQTIEVNVRKSEVIDKLGLVGADRHEWQHYVQYYLDDNTEALHLGPYLTETSRIHVVTLTSH